MKKVLDRVIGSVWPRFHGNAGEHRSSYYTFQDYRQIWLMAIFVLMSTALFPLIVITLIHYQLIDRSINTESLLRTERVTSNARRAVTFFLEERLAALKFTVSENAYDSLTNPGNLSAVLRNLKMGFGGLTDLSVIDDTGMQVAYAGPFNLEGKDYSKQPWFNACQRHNDCVSETFSGHRDVPHIVVAVKSLRPNGRFFVLRATLETERLIQALNSFKTGEHADIFLINRAGILQTPSQFYEGKSGRMSIPVPAYSDRTMAMISKDRSGQPIIVGYAFIETEIAPTSFILMVVKHKAGMMKVWLDLRSNIHWFLGLCVVIIFIVVTLTSTFMVNKIFQVDREKAKTMAIAEQSCQLASIGQLAAGVAHEINNPLALINETAGYVRDLFVIKNRYKNDAELLEYIDSIIEAVERCGTITRQLLGFARHLDVHIQPIDLNDIVTSVINFHKKEAEYRNIRIHVDIPETIPRIETDRGKLQQIILNLVNNAFQAIDNESFLDIRAEMDGLEHVRLSIRDSGCGISEDHLSKIFEPFFTTKAEGEGTGLGLSITYGLVQKLHGAITVQSEKGEGTTFLITLPIHIERKSKHECFVG